MNQNRATIFKAIFMTLEIVKLLALNTFKSSFARSKLNLYIDFQYESSFSPKIHPKDSPNIHHVKYLFH